MKITTIVYEEVRVTCLKDPTKDRTYHDATVTYRGIEVVPTTTLEIRETRGNHSALYARPEVVELTPDSAKFKAFWWSSAIQGEEGEEGDLDMIPIEVECYF